MSGPRLSTVQGRVCEDERFKLSHLKLLLFHGRVSDNNGWSWLYQESTAKKLNISRETVNRCLKDLVKWGYIQKEYFNRYGKRICAVRVILDYGEPAMPETLCDDDDPDGFKAFVKNHGQFVANDDQKTSKSQAQKQARTCEAEITGCVTSGPKNVCAADHRTCDVEPTCDTGGHRTCDIGDHTERRKQPLKGGGGNNKSPREANKATTTFLKTLFDEYNATAKWAGFKHIGEQYFEDVADELERTISKVGAEKWREFMAIAAGDDLCCGRVKAGANYPTPWRLDFKQMCKPLWIEEKLDEWKRAGKQPKTHNASATTITPSSPSWQAWFEHFQALGKNFHIKQMTAGNTIAVPSEWPPMAEMKQAGGAL